MSVYDFNRGSENSEDTYNYFIYEFTLLPLDGGEPRVITEVGFFVDTGTIQGVLRGPRERAEVILAIPSDNVWFVKNLGAATKTFDA